MSDNDKPKIPEITRYTTPTEAKGIRNAQKLLKHGEEGLASGTLPMHNGILNRKGLAKVVGFGRSAYQQNPLIEDIAVWIEKQLKQAPRHSGSNRGLTEEEQVPAGENERLKKRNIALKAGLNDASAKLRKLGYMEKTLEGGDARLPW